MSANVTISSGPLAKDGPVELSLKALTAKCLCEGHNNELSPLDQAGIDLQNVLRRTSELRSMRERLRRRGPWRHERFVVDGTRIERWLMKTAFSIAPVFRREIDDWRPTPDLAAMVFGLTSIPPGLGLYSGGQVGDSIRDQEEWHFSFGKATGDEEPTSMVLELRGGYRLICTWGQPMVSGRPYFFRNRVYPNPIFIPHPRTWFIGDQVLGVRIDFDWRGKWSEKHNPNVVALRSRYPSPSR